jgi:zinc protease
VAITWLAPSASSPDAAALSVLDAILAGGKSSRLYDSLVYDKQMAAQVFSDPDLRQQLGMYYVGAIVAAGHTPDEVIAALRAQVAALRDAPPTAKELEIAKTQLLTTAVRQRETIDGLAEGLASAQVIEGDAAKVNSDLDDLARVTTADVQRVAQAYLPDDLRVVVRYLPESQRPAGTPPPPIAPPPAPSTPYTGTVAALLPPDQRQLPPPAGPQAGATLPTPSERTLPNGLRVIVAKSTDLPLVAARLVIESGAASDPARLAGDANLTASLVTEGTASFSARDIARDSEALGADLSSGSSWDASQVALSVMPAKLPAALAIIADVARHPAFASAELERARKQQLDDLDVAYGDPGQVAGFATAAVAYAGTPFAHTEDGAPASLKRLTRDDLVRFHDAYWRPDNALLVLTGDITPEEGFALAETAFGDWPRPSSLLPPHPGGQVNAKRRDVAIDLPGTGQAAVVVVKPAVARRDPRYFAGVVANAVLGGGYSARLNEEIRIKRGLSYGADSALSAHRTLGAFIADAQTRNDAAVEVAGLIKAGMSSLADAPPTPDEIAARKSSLIGDYGRNIETATGLGGAISDLAIYGVDLGEIAAYPGKAEAVTPEQAQAFARDVLQPAGASTIVVGDGKQFLDALKTKSPDLDVIPIAAFDPDVPTLRAKP